MIWSNTFYIKKTNNQQYKGEGFKMKYKNTTSLDYK